MNRQEILEAASNAVVERAEHYAPPHITFEVIAEFWNAYDKARAQVPYTGTDVAVMLGLMKTARIAANPDHADSWVDVAGYAACGAEVQDRRREEVDHPT